MPYLINSSREEKSLSFYFQDYANPAESPIHGDLGWHLFPSKGSLITIHNTRQRKKENPQSCCAEEFELLTFAFVSKRLPKLTVNQLSRLIYSCI